MPTAHIPFKLFRCQAPLLSGDGHLENSEHQLSILALF